MNSARNLIEDFDSAVEDVPLKTEELRKDMFVKWMSQYVIGPIGAGLKTGYFQVQKRRLYLRNLPCGEITGYPNDSNGRRLIQIKVNVILFLKFAVIARIDSEGLVKFIDECEDYEVGEYCEIRVRLD